MRHHRATNWVVPIVLALCFAASATARPASSSGNNTSLSDSSDSSDGQLYCEKTTWYGICWFFFTNYLLHALSVRSLPGENVYSSTAFKLCCLLVPYTGVRRGLSLISRASSLTKDDLQAAARAGALCMVIRKPDWRPEDGQIVHGCQVKESVEEQAPEPVLASSDEKNKEIDVSTSEISGTGVSAGGAIASQNGFSLNIKEPYEAPKPSSFLDKISRVLVLTDRFNNDMPSSSPVDHENIKVHGLCKLAPGYGLSYISPNVKVYARHYAQLGDQDVKPTRIASTHDVPRILFSLIQTVSGGYSLYKARGSQIDRYGFAAFGLTVLPYMVVSIINFIASLLSAEYETVYMVHSTVMDEMVGRGGIVDGVVGSLQENTNTESSGYNGASCVEEDARRVAFQGSEDRLHGYDVGVENGRKFDILPYALPSPPPIKKWIVRVYHRYRQWHGLVTLYDPKPKTSITGPVINIPTHAPLHNLSPPWYQKHLNIFALIILSFTLALPYAVIGILTGWKARHSTSVQQNFVMVWLVHGQFQGYAVAKVERLTGKKSSIRAFFIIFLFYGSNCVCGLTVVAQEMLEFGTCKSMHGALTGDRDQSMARHPGSPRVSHVYFSELSSASVVEMVITASVG
ncbi:MAG: hypothetical protein Q9195_008821 [Heterodermia aff. obscurata]